MVDYACDYFADGAVVLVVAVGFCFYFVLSPLPALSRSLWVGVAWGAPFLGRVWVGPCFGTVRPSPGSGLVRPGGSWPPGPSCRGRPLGDSCGGAGPLVGRSPPLGGGLCVPPGSPGVWGPSLDIMLLRGELGALAAQAFELVFLRSDSASCS